ncbi:RagB/SusD family nutrient uptake outer membrane protein [Maribacter sp. ANRC-HE7]|uniref:RagB/SusD family nutrient uptake outer membrane protein n=1 Tax=Maribacter aquimaris TaxID=2737171 RepID=A0ABR7V1L6_9FLAO|nr:RagB/SusD family nutrient uptake outer membrane protein [Maribacter aquimaris]MBD0777814.1 RagB/SusD family nutrient uptake outer membrane protein [Maribacter aquimaris]
MKNIIFLISTLLLVTACSDVLEEEPKAVATETFYRTADEIESTVFAAYAPVWNAFKNVFWLSLGTEVDYAVGRASLTNFTDWQDPLSGSNQSRTSAGWVNLYQSIRNANLVIENAPNSLEATDDEITQFVAEAKFIRALDYFYLVRLWGAIPLRTFENMLDENVARSSEEDVYAFIISDLEYAESNLPLNQDIGGRANQDAAKAVLAHVYLQLERWSDARDKALDLINSGKYSLLEINTSDDYYNIYGPDVITTPEEIFYFKYSVESGNSMAAYRHSSPSPYWNATNGVYALYADSVNTKVISEWDYNDLRKNFNLYNADIGFGLTTMLFKKFITPGVVNNNGSYDYPAYKFSDILLFYAEADCRLNNGPTADGMEKLNMIHRRAYGQETKVASSVDFVLSDYNADTFIDLVLKEGMYEQMDEGKRTLELKRTGKLAQAIEENMGLTVNPARYLWPIPNNEYDYNGAIDVTTNQNPGY